MKRVVGIGGLSNRLRAVLSARAAWGECEALWAAGDAVHHASFTDVFHPLDRVTFIYAGRGHAHELDPVQWPHDVMTSNPIEEAPDGWTKAYSELKPLPHLQSRIDELMVSMGGKGQYTAIHARRLDHVAHAPQFGHYTTNEELHEWVQAQPPAPLYLATDDPGTQEWFRGKHSRIQWHRTPERVQGYEIRPGTLADAVVDMFVLAGAARFKGSWMSSFSETVGLLRCGGEPPGGFVARRHMQSADAEWYRGRPNRVLDFFAEERTR